MALWAGATSDNVDATDSLMLVLSRNNPSPLFVLPKPNSESL